MATKTITLTDVKITQLRIDYVQQQVVADFQEVDAAGTVWATGQAVFWVTLPTPPAGEQNPPLYFQLPSSYLPTLVQLQTDAKAAITAKVLT